MAHAATPAEHDALAEELQARAVRQFAAIRSGTAPVVKAAEVENVLDPEFDGPLYKMIHDEGRNAFEQANAGSQLARIVLGELAKRHAAGAAVARRP